MERTTLFSTASWILRLATAGILLQTLFFKFTGAKESVYIFSTLGLEPWARIGTGVAELLASVLLLIPSTVAWGALLSLGVISGAIFSHLTKLGITLPAVGDKGELFALAVLVFAGSAVLLLMYRHQLPVLSARRAAASAMLLAAPFVYPTATVEARDLVEPTFTKRGLGISGYDPVAYFEAGKPVKGSPSFTYDHQGAKYQFASGENLEKFKASPGKYIPQFGGYCAWAVSKGYTASTDPEAWKIVDGKLYLNYSKSVQQKWEQDVPGNIKAGEKNWPGLHK